ncbi:hypothetical protein OsJ_02871 [Oryza sativa Japonica Group]|uniref:Uncharacterized protein n=2 Tax=Oryza sativa subsp. japonica TaxID=39947 RepID=B9EYE6_ORYSJ|nr:hypothetical protein OsJ_02871 [Oryza sativa Japonica Group]
MKAVALGAFKWGKWSGRHAMEFGIEEEEVTSLQRRHIRHGLVGDWGGGMKRRKIEGMGSSGDWGRGMKMRKIEGMKHRKSWRHYLVLMAPIIDGPPDPSFSVRLVGVEGLDVDADARLSGPRSSSPAALPGLRRGQGRHRAARLVPRHDGIVLARAPVPSFCIDGKLLEGGGAVGVVVVKAEAAAANAKMRKGLRDLIWTERRVLGKVDFDVEGNLGEQVTRDDLNCKVSSFEGAKGRFESI